MVITELQRELQELEADLGNEARAKARLHAMNSRLVQVIRELEATARDLAGTDARVYRRVGTHLQRTAQAIEELNSATSDPGANALALLGRGSFQQ